MNFYDALKKKLSENGMLDSQIEPVMQLALADESFSNMNGRWSQDTSGYPEGFTNILFHLVRPIAYQWICENAPQAWFRPVFAPGAVALSAEEAEKFVKDYHTKVYDPIKGAAADLPSLDEFKHTPNPEDKKLDIYIAPTKSSYYPPNRRTK